LVVVDGLFTCFKTTPERIEVRVGDDLQVALPTILNEADLSYKLQVVNSPDWIEYDISSKTFSLFPSISDFKKEIIILGDYEIEMEWNAKGGQEYSGAFFGSEFLD